MKHSQSNNNRRRVPGFIRFFITTAKIVRVLFTLFVRIPVAILEIFQRVTLTVRKICRLAMSGVGLYHKTMEAKATLAAKMANS